MGKGEGMRQILFVKYNRTRAAQFQLKTEIVREDEVLTVEKTALTEAGEAHIRSFGEKYEKKNSSYFIMFCGDSRLDS